MAMNETDHEYGPTPEGANREYTDIEPSIAWKFALWLTVAMLISAGIVYGTFWFFEGREEAANDSARVFPLAAGQVKEPPAPTLQTQPFKDIFELRQREQERLTTYGWVDKGSGTTHIPIEDAMRLLVDRGALQPRGGQGSEPAGVQRGDLPVMSDSSAGRVPVSR